MLFEEKVFIVHGMAHVQPTQHVSCYWTHCLVLLPFYTMQEKGVIN